MLGGRFAPKYTKGKMGLSDRGMGSETFPELQVNQLEFFPAANYWAYLWGGGGTGGGR